MSKILEMGNMRILEYPEGAENPYFEIDKHGRLFVSGYLTYPFGEGRPVRSLRAFNGFNGYTVIGKYDYAKTVIESKRDLAEIIYSNDLCIDRCVILVKTETVPEP